MKRLGQFIHHVTEPLVFIVYEQKGTEGERDVEGEETRTQDETKREEGELLVGPYRK